MACNGEYQINHNFLSFYLEKPKIDIKDGWFVEISELLRVVETVCVVLNHLAIIFNLIYNFMIDLIYWIQMEVLRMQCVLKKWANPVGSRRVIVFIVCFGLKIHFVDE